MRASVLIGKLKLRVIPRRVTCSGVQHSTGGLMCALVVVVIRRGGVRHNYVGVFAFPERMFVIVAVAILALAGVAEVGEEVDVR